MVTKRELLEVLTLAKLKRIARQLGVRVGKGVTGFLSEQVLGLQLRGPYIETLANSPIVTLEEIDRVLGTNYSGTQTGSDPDPVAERPARRARSAPPEGSPESSDDSVLARRNAAENILGSYVYKEGVQEICEDLGLPVSGSKDELIKRLLRSEGFTLDLALAYVGKDGLKAFCEEMKLPIGGTREDLVNRILEVFEDEETANGAPRMSSLPLSQSVDTPARLQSVPNASQSAQQPPPRRALFAPQDISGEPPLEYPETPSPTLIPEPTAPLVVQLQMVAEFLESYRPSQRFRNEQAYEIEIAQSMRHHFGAENVKTQANIPGGRIDVEVLGIGVELKVPANRGQFQTLLGQVSVYRNYYGSNFMVVVYGDFAKVQDVNEFCNILRRRGVKVFVK